MRALDGRRGPLSIARDDTAEGRLGVAGVVDVGGVPIGGFLNMRTPMERRIGAGAGVATRRR